MRCEPAYAAALTAALGLALTAGCGGGSDPDPTVAPVPKIATTAPPAPSDGEPATTDRMLEVRGHEMFIACLGTGSPTVVYMHGMGGTAVGGTDIAKRLGDDNRVCTYDRPNGLGISETLEGPLTGKDSVADMHALLAAAEVPGPYVLLGASHGGLLAGMYAATYPDDVVGMVLLDSPLPYIFEYEDPYLPDDSEFQPAEWEDSPEKLDEARTFRQAQALQGRQPKIPVTYLAAKGTDLPPSLPRKKIIAADRRLQRDYLARFTPGRLVLVDSPHYMEPEIPGRIAREVRRVVAASAPG
jgi:pimeloyl-ACP methyl ester carboxylesterase